MMEPMTESEAMETSSPSPPPVPLSPPPDEEMRLSQSPPSKPKKSKRSISPTKENGHLNNRATENGVQDDSVEEKSEQNKCTEGEKVNGYANHKSEEDSNGDAHSQSYGQGGVAKIVDEIEKYNSLGKPSKSSGETPEKTAKMEEVRLRDLSPEKTEKLTPLERSVLREMPVDVDIENGDMSNTTREARKQSRSGRENGALNGEGDDSPRKGTPVKRTPTMEFKKQCSKIVRIRTKILQNLGKADKTTDTVFDEYEANFTRQQNNANRLHKEVTNYLRCARALQGASKALFDTLADVYETEWTGSDLIYAQAQNSEMLWTDFIHKLQDQSVAPLTAYQIQFPELRKKIDKRGRKLVDYDSTRHQLEALQRSNRRDEYKLARCKDQLEGARTTYDALNKELYEELPAIYDQRVLHTSESLQTLYAAEATFMRESAKVSQELEAITDKLAGESRQGKYRVNRGTPVTPKPVSYSAPQPQATECSDDSSNDVPNGSLGAPKGSLSPSPTAESPPTQDTNGVPQPSSSTPAPSNPPLDNLHNGAKEEIGRPYEEIQFDEGAKVNGTAAIGTKVPPDNKAKRDELYDIPVGANTSGLPSGVLYQVRTTYKYDREDVDELTFEVGEIINVVEYDDPEEQEEGWLCGYKASSNEKGLFPANFTRPI